MIYLLLQEFKNSNSIVKLEKEIDDPIFLPKDNSILEQNVFNSYHSWKGHFCNYFLKG